MSAHVVVVTGAGTPVGAAAVERFRRGGAVVVAADRAAGAGIVALDPRDPAASLAIVERTVAEHGRLDAWINLHRADVRGPVADLDPADLEAALGAVVTGSLLCARAAQPAIAASGGGAIVNVGTVDAFHSAAGGVADGVVQAALVKLTQALGIEWATTGVRVVGVAHGSVAGEGTAALMPDARIPLRRPANPDEVAQAIEQLAGPQASYVVGETLRVDGGWSSYQLF